jgi:hypothetical protein
MNKVNYVTWHRDIDSLTSERGHDQIRPLHVGEITMISAVFAATAVLTCSLLLFAPFTRTALWRATVTPLASIIGSGFLESAPLLAHDFGGYAVLAMTLLVVLAALIGWAIRYNIAVVEPQIKQGKIDRFCGVRARRTFGCLRSVTRHGFRCRGIDWSGTVHGLTSDSRMLRQCVATLPRAL